MEIEERKVEVEALARGMFVCRLDRPWEETPFLLQGFLIDNDEQVEQLRRFCSHVFIDVRKSTADVERHLQTLGTMRAQPRLGGGVGSVNYSDHVDVEQEVPLARRARDNARSLARRIVDDVREHRRLSPEAVTDAVEPIVESVIRSADAFFWLEALSKRDSYNYSHAINCCALAASFGRHLGLPKELIVELATGGMLMDIGKAALPQGTIDHGNSLDATQLKAMRSHVGLGITLIEQAGIGGPELLSMVSTHHERHDGSGYPNGLSGSQIPLYGRILGIIDTYDAMSSPRHHQPAKSRHDVLQTLYRERDRLFQGQLVEQFTQCLGVYPTGSLVELSTGEVAIIMAQNPARRLFPRVTVLTKSDKSIDPAFRQVDLLLESMTPDPANQIRIARALPPGAYGLDAAELYL